MGGDTALLIDYQPIGESFRSLIEILKRSGKIGEIAIARAYSSWGNHSSKTREEAVALGIECVPAPPGKDGADLALAMDAIQISSRLPIRIFCIVTCDGGNVFRVLIKRLHSNHRIVLCGREGNTSRRLKAICDAYVPIPSEGGISAIRETGRTTSVSPLPMDVQESGQSTHAPSVDDSPQRILDVLQSKPSNLKKMQSEGLPIGSVAERLRPYKHSQSGKNRWLLKLLQEVCTGAPVCLARAPSRLEYRLFLRGNVADGYDLIK
jgi:NYN domain